MPPAPSLIYPVQGEISPWNPPFFQWSSVSSALGYRLMVSKKTDFDTSLISTLIIDSNAISVYELTYLVPFSDSTFYWKVQSLNEGNVGNTSGADSFKVQFPLVYLPDSLISVSNLRAYGDYILVYSYNNNLYLYKVDTTGNIELQNYIPAGYAWYSRDFFIVLSNYNKYDFYRTDDLPWFYFQSRIIENRNFITISEDSSLAFFGDFYYYILYIYDISVNPGIPVDTFNLSHYSSGLVAFKNFLYIPAGNNIYIYKYLPGTLIIKDSLKFMNNIADIKVQGDTLIVLSGETVYIYNLTNPQNPSLSFTIPITVKGSIVRYIPYDKVLIRNYYRVFITDIDGKTRGVIISNLSADINGNYLFTGGNGIWVFKWQ